MLIPVQSWCLFLCLMLHAIWLDWTIWCGVQYNYYILALTNKTSLTLSHQISLYKGITDKCAICFKCGRLDSEIKFSVVFSYTMVRCFLPLISHTTLFTWGWQAYLPQKCFKCLLSIKQAEPFILMILSVICILICQVLWKFPQMLVDLSSLPSHMKAWNINMINNKWAWHLHKGLGHLWTFLNCQQPVVWNTSVESQITLWLVFLYKYVLIIYMAPSTVLLIKCNKKSEIMRQFRSHYAAFQGSLCGKLCNFFPFILSYCLIIVLYCT